MKLTRVLAASCIASALCLTVVAAQPAPAPAPTYEPKSGQPGKDVVWIPTQQALVDRMLEMAQVTPNDYLVDLGSGDGRTVISAAKKGVRALGIEFNPDLVAVSVRAAEQEGVGDKARFVQGDIFESDLSDATVVTMFLLPSLNLRLRPTILAMRPGTRIVSNTFTMADWTPDQTFETTTNCTNFCRAYKWVVPARVEGKWRLADGEIDLQQSFQMLSGKLRLGDQDIAISDARMNGAEIAFTAGDMQFTGRVDGDRIEGRSRSPQGERAWSARRNS